MDGKCTQVLKVVNEVSVNSLLPSMFTQAIPMCNEHFAVLTGKFKLPLLKGEHGPHSVQHYKSMEQAIANDLNTWLCNMYIEIRHVVRDKEMEKPSTLFGFNFIAKTLNHTLGQSNGDELIANKSIKRITGQGLDEHVGGDEEEDEDEQAALLLSRSLDRKMFHKQISRDHDISDTYSNKVVKKKDNGMKKNSAFGSFYSWWTGGNGSFEGIKVKPSPTTADHSLSKTLVVSEPAGLEEEALGLPLTKQAMYTEGEEEAVHKLQSDTRKMHSKDEIIEKGYNSEDEFFMDPEQVFSFFSFYFLLVFFSCFLVFSFSRFLFFLSFHFYSRKFCILCAAKQAKFHVSFLFSLKRGELAGLEAIFNHEGAQVR